MIAFAVVLVFSAIVAMVMFAELRGDQSPMQYLCVALPLITALGAAYLLTVFL